MHSALWCCFCYSHWRWTELSDSKILCRIGWGWQYNCVYNEAYITIHESQGERRVLAKMRAPRERGGLQLKGECRERGRFQARGEHQEREENVGWNESAGREETMAPGVILVTSSIFWLLSCREWLCYTISVSQRDWCFIRLLSFLQQINLQSRVFIS